MPTDDTKGYAECQLERKQQEYSRTHNLELDRNHSEVQDLDSRPEYIVGPERGQIHVLEFASQRPPTATLSNGHKGEEARQTYMQPLAVASLRKN